MFLGNLMPKHHSECTLRTNLLRRVHQLGHIEIEVTDPTFCLTESHFTDACSDSSKFGTSIFVLIPVPVQTVHYYIQRSLSLFLFPFRLFITIYSDLCPYSCPRSDCSLLYTTIFVLVPVPVQTVHNSVHRPVSLFLFPFRLFITRNIALYLFVEKRKKLCMREIRLSMKYVWGTLHRKVQYNSVPVKTVQNSVQRPQSLFLSPFRLFITSSVCVVTSHPIGS